MTTKKIGSYTELQKAIEELNEHKAKKEVLLQQKLADIKTDLNPLNILKSYLAGVVHDNELHSNVFKAMAGIGSKFIADKILNKDKDKNQSFLNSLIEKLMVRIAK